MSLRKGFFFVIYGPNNIGKSEQTRLFAARYLKETGKNLLILKYPIYSLRPTGLKINRILRPKGIKVPIVSEIEWQKLCAKNRRDFEPTLIKVLSSGIDVLAEDYVGTGIAWGLTKGQKLSDLEKINSKLLKEDLAILLDGERFEHAKEPGHIFEDSHLNLWDKSRQAHLRLAKRYKWRKVSANNSLEKVHEDVWGEFKSFLDLRQV